MSFHPRSAVDPPYSPPSAVIDLEVIENHLTEQNLKEIQVIVMIVDAHHVFDEMQLVIFMSYRKFYDVGLERLANDLTVLFGGFKAWCLRPEGFFPKLSEGLKILKMEDKLLRGSVEGGDRWLNQNMIRHLTLIRRSYKGDLAKLEVDMKMWKGFVKVHVAAGKIEQQRNGVASCRPRNEVKHLVSCLGMK
ncbi:RINT1-like protein MAG2 [Tanacetum coccineum]